jgi:hypothetical protein
VCFESYKEPPEDQEYAAGILSKVRASIRATVASSSLQLDPVVVSNGVFLDEFHFNDADEGEPRTVDASARIFAPNGSGNYVQLSYHNHCRVRQSFTERSSSLTAVKGNAGDLIGSSKDEGDENERLQHRRPKHASGLIKIFELDYNEYRLKNPTKTSLASNAALKDLVAHLFGVEDAVSFGGYRDAGWTTFFWLPQMRFLLQHRLA